MSISIQRKIEENLYVKKICSVIFWICYSIIISMPLSSNLGFSIPFVDRLVKLSMYIIIMNTIIYILRIKSIKLTRCDIILLLLYLLYTLSFIIGLFKFKLYAIDDFRRFIEHLFIFISASIIIDKNTIKIFTKLTIYSLILNGLILVIIKFILLPKNIVTMSITHETINGRFGVTNQSLYIIIIPLLFYYIYESKRLRESKVKYFIFILLLLYLLGVNASRTLIIMTVINLIFIMIAISIHYRSINISKKFKWYNKFKFIVYFILIISAFCGIIYYLNYINSPIINRFQDLLLKTGSFSSLTSRDITNDYYISQVKKNIFGYGFGSFMPLIDSKYKFYQVDWFYTDNTIVTLLYKGGVAAVLLLIIFIINIYRYNLKLYYVTRKEEYLILLATIPSFLLSMYATSTQVIHSPVIYMFIWTYFAIIDGDYKQITNNLIKITY